MHRRPEPVSSARRAWARAALALPVAAALPGTMSGCASDSTPALPVGDLPRQLRQVIREAGVPGALVRVETPEGLYQDAIGVADLATGAPMDVSLTYRIGSNTKPMVCWLALRLIAEGRLGFDDPVAAYRAGVPGGERITVRMLGNMTSGLPMYEQHPEFLAALESKALRPWSTGQLLDYAFDRPSSFEPGTRWEYANVNTVLLGDILERVTGSTLSELLRVRLFEPLGMSATTMPRSAAFERPHVRGYTRMYTSSAEVEDATDIDPSWSNAAGIVISSLGDMARWLPVLARGDGLPSSVLRERLVGLLDGPSRYGFGHVRFGDWFGHNGMVFGYNSFHVASPERGATIGVMCNADYTAQMQEAATLVFAHVLARLFPGSDGGVYAELVAA